MLEKVFEKCPLKLFTKSIGIVTGIIGFDLGYNNPLNNNKENRYFSAVCMSASLARYPVLIIPIMMTK